MRSGFDKRIEQLVHDWRELHKGNLESHLKAYRRADSLERALYRASRAYQDEKSDRRNSHQYRLPKDAPLKILKALTASIGSIKAAKDFDDLYRVVRTAIKHVHGVGHLMIYDTTLRIGSHLKIKPDKVYLQSGALDGAKEYFRLARVQQRLVSGVSIDTEMLPLLSTKLSADQIENFLCTMRKSMDPTVPISHSHGC